MKEKLKIKYDMLDHIDKYLLKENNPVIDRLIRIVESYGGPEKINEDAKKSGRIEILLDKLQKKKPEYIKKIKMAYRTEGYEKVYFDGCI